MGSLRFPAEVPAGPLQELLLALHELHGLAGEPSVREMADAVGCSHHKVHQMFTQPRLPSDGDTLWAVAEWLARQGRRPRIRTEDDEEEFWTWFEGKWSRAKRWVLLEPSGLDIVSPPGTSDLPSSRGNGSPPREATPTSRAANATHTPDNRAADLRNPRGQVITADFARTQEHRIPRSSLLPDPHTSQAVLMGASSFESAELPDLPSVAAGVRALSTILTDPDREGSFLPASTQTVIDPTRIGLLEAVEKAADAAEDVLLVYFAGHGLLTPRGELALAGRDTRIRRDYTSASWDTVRELLSNSRARRSLVILDACFSGRAAEAMGPLSGLAEVPTGTYVLSATGRYHAAIAPAGKKYTAFTGPLIELLTEGDPAASEYLTIDVIYRYLDQRMARDGLPRPERRSTGAGDLALGRNPAYIRDAQADPRRAK
jgi:Caspase domain